MHALIEGGGFVAEAEVTSLATALADKLEPGRRSPDRLTVGDLTGTGVQETAIPAASDEDERGPALAAGRTAERSR